MPHIQQQPIEEKGSLESQGAVEKPSEQLKGKELLETSFPEQRLESAQSLGEAAPSLSAMDGFSPLVGADFKTLGSQLAELSKKLSDPSALKAIDDLIGASPLLLGIQGHLFKVAAMSLKEYCITYGCEEEQKHYIKEWERKAELLKAVEEDKKRKAKLLSRHLYPASLKALRMEVLKALKEGQPEAEALLEKKAEKAGTRETTHISLSSILKKPTKLAPHYYATRFIYTLQEAEKAISEGKISSVISMAYSVPVEELRSALFGAAIAELVNNGKKDEAAKLIDEAEKRGLPFKLRIDSKKAFEHTFFVVETTEGKAEIHRAEGKAKIVLFDGKEKSPLVTIIEGDVKSIFIEGKEGDFKLLINGEEVDEEELKRAGGKLSIKGPAIIEVQSRKGKVTVSVKEPLILHLVVRLLGVSNKDHEDMKKEKARDKEVKKDVKRRDEKQK